MTIRALAATAVAIALVAACGSDDGSGTAATAPAGTTVPATTTTTAPTDARGPGPAPTSFPAGMGSTDGDGVFPRTVTHYKGQTTIEADPERIIVIGTGQADVVLTLGIVPIGAVARDGAATVQPYLAEAYPGLASQIADVAAVGTNADVNFEAIAALEPDLILDNGGAEAETYEQLAAIAPTVITAGTGVNWKQDFLLIASALGRSGEAEQFMAEYDADAAALAAVVAAAPPTVSFVRFNTGRARMFGVPSFAGSIAWDAGLDRPEPQQFDKTSQDLSEELIAAVDADWLFYSVQGDPAATPVDAYISNPLWGNLGAVAGGHVTVVPDDPWFLSAGPAAARIVLDGLAGTFAG